VAETLAALDGNIVAAYREPSGTALDPTATVVEALAALALASDRSNVFLLNDSEKSGEKAPEPAAVIAFTPAKSRRGLGQRWLLLPRRCRRSHRTTAASAVQTSVHIAPATDYNGDLLAILREQYAPTAGLCPWPTSEWFSSPTWWNIIAIR